MTVSFRKKDERNTYPNDRRRLFGPAVQRTARDLLRQDSPARHRAEPSGQQATCWSSVSSSGDRPESPSGTASATHEFAPSRVPKIFVLEHDHDPLEPIALLKLPGPSKGETDFDLVTLVRPNFGLLPGMRHPSEGCPHRGPSLPVEDGHYNLVPGSQPGVIENGVDRSLLRSHVRVQPHDLTFRFELLRSVWTEHSHRCKI